MNCSEIPPHPDWQAAKHRPAFSSGALKPSIGLPAGKTKMDALKAVKKARRSLDLKPAALDYLERLVRMTKAEDWSEGATPVAFGQVKTMADELDVDERTINNYERCLAERGLILWNDYGNCRRFGRRDENGKLVDAYGIVLSPLIERFGEIEKMGEADALDLKLRTSEIGRIRSVRRGLKYLMGLAQAHGLEPSVTQPAETVIGRIPERAFSKKAWPTISVCSLRLEIENVIARLKQELSLVSVDEFSGQTEENFRYQYTEDTRKTPVRNSNLAAPRRTSPDGDEVIPPAEPANAGGIEEGSRRRSRNSDNASTAEDSPGGGSSDSAKLRNETSIPVAGSGGSTGIEHIRFDQVTDAASDLMRELIAEEAGQGKENWSALDRAAATAAAWIGVSPSLWATMRAQIGPAAAAVSVVLVERRMTDPDNPVSKPGGYLRGMLAKAGRGQLHLHKSIFGLSKSATSRRAIQQD